MRALAIIPAYNEADIIGWTVKHLIQQGLSVHVIDTCSTDETARIARAAGAAVELYHVRNGRVSWRAILERVEKLAADPARVHHWYMFQDADEIRRSPIDGETLLGAFERMDGEGFDCAQFRVVTYYPTDNSYDGRQDPEMHFSHFEYDEFNRRIGQQKAWKNTGPVEIAWSGGHLIRPPRRVHPLPLISKHYPIRSQQHGERKVFRERRNRWSDPERDWHVQYEHVQPGHNFLTSVVHE